MNGAVREAAISASDRQGTTATAIADGGPSPTELAAATRYSWRPQSTGVSVAVRAPAGAVAMVSPSRWTR